MNHRLLVVDDNVDNLSSTREFFEAHGFRVDVAASGKEAISLIRTGRKRYALILMDYDMPLLNGAEASREILEIQPKQPIAMYTCHDNAETVKTTWRSGLVEFLEKHMDADLLLEKVRAICAKYSQTVQPVGEYDEPDANQKKCEAVGLVGRSPQSARLADEVQICAPCDQTVILHGESGTGKELIARALHLLSPRKDKPFIAINCGGIPESLLESILFGHEKGAFTGAIKSHLGKFALAHRGTLFLDEIGDMPLSFQVKLLRVLQEEVIEPVGGNRTQPVDVRIIVASHKDLKEEVKKGTFREDLYYRLSVLEIKIPPLRDRPEDIEVLVAHFSKKFSGDAPMPKAFEAETLPLLKAYSWPGNVRELENLVNRHLVRVQAPTIGIKDLEPKLRSGTVLGPQISDLEAQQREQMILCIREALSRSRTQAEAARRLGISPSRLSYYLGIYCIAA